MLIGKKNQNLSDVILKSFLFLKQINVLQIKRFPLVGYFKKL